ncbi:hypothetical protein QJQ45_019932 [Haematococcus lacustris]|nr:hypothetical protein QJQ45_019932 [Haematococcus lacustris]
MASLRPEAVVLGMLLSRLHRKKQRLKPKSLYHQARAMDKALRLDMARATGNTEPSLSRRLVAARPA